MTGDRRPPIDQSSSGPEPEHVTSLLEQLRRALDATSAVILGQSSVVEGMFLSMMAGGHVLVEGAPGLGKTLLVRTIAAVCGLEFSRIQFTPDLMPADITGANVLIHDDGGRARTRFQPGPIFAQLVLADEINRSTPKTQSALLEAMQERTVTAGGREHELPRPFFVMATQNPIEMEGTYDLPEAQVDRFFMKIDVEFPAEDALGKILTQDPRLGSTSPEQFLAPSDLVDLRRAVLAVHLPEIVRDAVVQFVRSTQPTLDSASDRVRTYVRLGVSPRGAQYLILAAKARALLDGRFNASLQDVRTVATPVLRHRLHTNFAAVADGVTREDLLDGLVSRAISAANSE